MQIVSASRRTDIPAHYPEWFMGRVREGLAGYRNPFSGAEHEVSLRPEDVRCFVFWSKNFEPFEPHLKELEERGYNFYFLFTITGLPRVFEERVPPPESALRSFSRLSERYGPKRTVWRFDPIVLSNLTPKEERLETFLGLCRELEGKTERCIVSFPTMYGKVRRNLDELRERKGVEVYLPSEEERREFARELAQAAAASGISLLACCSDYLVGGPVGKASCVDGKLIDELFPDHGTSFKPLPTRRECGCTESRDIGAYDSCSHGCWYCYANQRPGGPLRSGSGLFL
ncbi:MAG: DUF1848 domain-containing protein [Nitrospinota bacterium]